MLTFQQLLNEIWMDGIEGTFGYAELFKDPTLDELEKIASPQNYSGSPDDDCLYVGAIITKDHIIAFNRLKTEHHTVQQSLGMRWDEQFSGVYMYYYPDDKHVTVSRSGYESERKWTNGQLQQILERNISLTGWFVEVTGDVGQHTDRRNLIIVPHQGLPVAPRKDYGESVNEEQVGELNGSFGYTELYKNPTWDEITTRLGRVKNHFPATPNKRYYYAGAFFFPPAVGHPASIIAWDRAQCEHGDVMEYLHPRSTKKPMHVGMYLYFYPATREAEFMTSFGNSNIQPDIPTLLRWLQAIPELSSWSWKLKD